MECRSQHFSRTTLMLPKLPLSAPRTFSYLASPVGTRSCALWNSGAASSSRLKTPLESPHRCGAESERWCGDRPGWIAAMSSNVPGQAWSFLTRVSPSRGGGAAAAALASAMPGGIRASRPSRARWGRAREAGDENAPKSVWRQTAVGQTVPSVPMCPRTGGVRRRFTKEISGSAARATSAAPTRWRLWQLALGSSLLGHELQLGRGVHSLELSRGLGMQRRAGLEPK